MKFNLMKNIHKRGYPKDPLRRDFIRLRRQKRVKQIDAAAKMGVSSPALSAWERGRAAVGEWRVYRAMDWMEAMR